MSIAVCQTCDREIDTDFHSGIWFVDSREMDVKWYCSPECKRGEGELPEDLRAQIRRVLR
jgi:hypothetical protein